MCIFKNIWQYYVYTEECVMIRAIGRVIETVEVMERLWNVSGYVWARKEGVNRAVQRREGRVQGGDGLGIDSRWLLLIRIMINSGIAISFEMMRSGSSDGFEVKFKVVVTCIIMVNVDGKGILVRHFEVKRGGKANHVFGWLAV